MAVHEPLIGAHTSAAGGSFNALIEGEKIGANCIQFFTNNQKQWRARTIAVDEIERFKALKDKTGISNIMSHDSYLINLGCPNQENLEKSRIAFKHEIERCHALGVDFMNFHPGAALKSSEKECLDTIVESLLQVEGLCKKGSTVLLIEATAGQGSTVGWNFKQIGYLVKHTSKKIPIGVCIDTCHIFAGGYDIRTKKGWQSTLDEFDKEIGLKYLRALHLNDSMHPLGSRKDRHAPLGQGEIGIECFKVLMSHPNLKELPKYLETPKTELWPDEIKLLKSFYKR
jgi:deoxyribonuclease IV